MPSMASATGEGPGLAGLDGDRDVGSDALYFTVGDDQSDPVFAGNLR
jgi:hypothetical protein